MKRNLPILTLLAGAAVFGAGLIYLFLLRFETGDVYPPYSSLRSDPLGTMALCESLEKISGVEVRRDMRDANVLPEERATTYLHLAAEVSAWEWLPDSLFDELERFATRGGRFVITMRPVMGWEFWTGPRPVTTITNAPPTVSPGSTNAPVTTNAPATGPMGRQRAPTKKAKPQKSEIVRNEISLAKRWGVEFGRVELKQGANDVYETATVRNESGLPLPATLGWHSALVLTNLDASWKVIYARGKHPVLAEKKFGKGAVVIATDSYFLSNQAMWKDREPKLLAWLVGPARHVVFDEAHLGVVESSGVAVLMRRYRLTGVIGATLVLAALFIWKNSISLVPPMEDGAKANLVTGKDATAGFVNLLRRNLPPSKILEVCFEQWTRSLSARANYRIAAVDQAQAVMEAERTRPAKSRNPVRAYREIAQALQSRHTPHATRHTPSAVHQTPDTPHPAQTP